MRLTLIWWGAPAGCDFLLSDGRTRQERPAKDTWVSVDVSFILMNQNGTCEISVRTVSIAVANQANRFEPW